jgi:hypothetical protein
MMAVDLRGFTYYTKDWGDNERWESNFSEYQVSYFNGLYTIGKKDDEFISFGSDNVIHMDLSMALNIVRLRAINKFFSDEY